MKTTKALLALFALTVLPLTACSDDDDDSASFSITPSSVSFYFEEEQQLTASDNTVVTWSTDDDFVAWVDDNGLLTASHVGTTLAKATDSKNNVVSIPVTVMPTYVTYAEPYLNWGASASDVKKNVSYTLVSEDDEAIIYQDGDFAYCFNFDDGKYMGLTVLVPTSIEAKEITVYIFERYEYVSKSNGTYYFQTPEQKTFLGMKVYSSKYYSITYVDYSTASSKSLALDQVEALATSLAL